MFGKNTIVQKYKSTESVKYKKDKSAKVQKCQVYQEHYEQYRSSGPLDEAARRLLGKNTRVQKVKVQRKC